MSKLQSTIALSSLEAEYIALCTCAQEATYLRELLKSVDPDLVAKPTEVKEDNQGCIAIALNPVHHSRTKHIDVKFHYVRQCLQRRYISVSYCPTEFMIADLLTKPLQGQKFIALRASIMGERSI